MPLEPTREQQQMIESTEGYQRCAAVPGSGKTFCLTRRIAYLITELYIDPSSIIGLTFTNKAASSMRRRLRDLVGDDSSCFMGTFHGFCNMVLREESHRLSWPRTFSIIDTGDQTDLVRQAAGRFRVCAVVPNRLPRTAAEVLRAAGVGILISIESSGLGLYKSVSYEVFRNRPSILLAFDGNSAALNLIQQARNSSNRHRIYINPRSRGLTEKAKMLDGYVQKMGSAEEILAAEENR